MATREDPNAAGNDRREDMPQGEVETLLRWLAFGVDDYTLALIIVIAREGYRDTVNLGKAFGMSKQATHALLDRKIAKYPELRCFLELAVRRTRRRRALDNLKAEGKREDGDGKKGGGDRRATVDITTRALAGKRGNRLTEIDGDGEEAEGQGQEGRSCGAA